MFPIQGHALNHLRKTNETGWLIDAVSVSVLNTTINSPESNANNAMREAIRVRSFVLSSLDTCPVERFPSGQMLLLEQKSQDD